MRRRNLVLMVAMVLCLSLVVVAQLPRTNQSQPAQPALQVDQDRIEAAHGKLLSGEDKAKEASRLTEAVAPALPITAASTAPIPRKEIWHLCRPRRWLAGLLDSKYRYAESR